MSPALPNEVSSAGPRRSTSTVERPRFCRCSATQTPTIPAPRTSASADFNCAVELPGVVLEKKLLHAAQPAVVVGSLHARIVEHLRVRQDEKFLGGDGLHELVHHPVHPERTLD